MFLTLSAWGGGNAAVRTDYLISTNHDDEILQNPPYLPPGNCQLRKREGHLRIHKLNVIVKSSLNEGNFKHMQNNGLIKLRDKRNIRFVYLYLHL